METDNSKISEIFKNLIFSEAELKIIESAFHKVNCKKGTIILNADDMANDQYFIYSGCLRSYHTDNQGKEHTVQFGIKDWWISDYTAFFSEDKALMNIEVLQDAVLYE
jgi:CRP-like cAMP-binding protein